MAMLGYQRVPTFFIGSSIHVIPGKVEGKTKASNDGSFEYLFSGAFCPLGALVKQRRFNVGLGVEVNKKNRVEFLGWWLLLKFRIRRCVCVLILRFLFE